MSHPPRILFVSSVAGTEGGAERSLLELARALHADGARPAIAVFSEGELSAAFRSAGMDVFALYPTPRDPASPLGGRTRDFPLVAPLVTRLARLRVSLMPLRAERRWLEQVITRAAPDVIHTNCDVSPLVVARVRRGAACWIAHVRDRVRFWAHPRVARALRSADAVIASSVHLADWLASHAISAVVVPNPVDARVLSRAVDEAERRRIREQLALPGPTLAVAIIGRLDTQKGARLLPDIVCGVERATFLLAGRSEPEVQAGLERALRSAGVADRVRFLGYRRDVEQWLPALDALVLTATGEAFGRVVVEGMLAGLAVVAADDGGARELIRDGETGLLAAAGNPEAFVAALIALRDDPVARHRIGDAGRADARARFEPSAVARQVRDVYERAAC